MVRILALVVCLMSGVLVIVWGLFALRANQANAKKITQYFSLSMAIVMTVTMAIMIGYLLRS